MATKNDITGDTIQSRVNTAAFSDGFDEIFARPYTVTYKVNNKEKTATVVSPSRVEARRKFLNANRHELSLEIIDVA